MGACLFSLQVQSETTTQSSNCWSNEIRELIKIVIVIGNLRWSGVPYGWVTDVGGDRYRRERRGEEVGLVCKVGWWNCLATRTGKWAGRLEPESADCIVMMVRSAEMAVVVESDNLKRVKDSQQYWTEILHFVILHDRKKMWKFPLTPSRYFENRSAINHWSYVIDTVPPDTVIPTHHHGQCAHGQRHHHEEDGDERGLEDQRLEIKDHFLRKYQFSPLELNIDVIFVR